MFLRVELQQEFHDNGALAYEQTIAILKPEHEAKFDRRIMHPDGYCFIRIGRNVKYFDNGQLAWQLDYNDKGEVIKNKDQREYRKDGTIIIY